jgi:murein DD-endopeptidase MepM/ murein hydrolase activator NlpD
MSFILSTIQKGLITLTLVLAFIAQSTAQTYKLPFAGGSTYTCTQGNGGSTSHSGSEQYAYDFFMPIGTTIVAMRSGTVSMVQQSFADYNCSNSTCVNDVNRVVINHGDGTQSLYLHLTKNGSLVSVGQQVVQGQPIAKSGSSGRSTGPHLHVQVSGTCGIWYCQSTPLSFGDVTGGIPKSGTAYRSGNYQQATSDVRLASNMVVSPNPIVQGSSITVGLSVKNFNSTAFSGQIAVALHDVNGAFLGDIEIKSVNFAANTTQALSFYKSSISSSAGAYKLYAKYLATGSTTWITMPVSTGVNPLSINIIQLTTLNVLPATLNTFAANGGSAILNVSTNAPLWSVTSTVSWAKVSKVGSAVLVSIDPNTVASTRSGSITIMAGSLSRQISVNQAAAVIVTTLSASPTSHSVAASSGTVSSTVVTNAPSWSVVSNSTAWLSVTKIGNNVSLKYSANTFQICS